MGLKVKGARGCLCMLLAPPLIEQPCGEVLAAARPTLGAGRGRLASGNIHADSEDSRDAGFPGDCAGEGNVANVGGAGGHGRTSFPIHQITSPLLLAGTWHPPHVQCIRLVMLHQLR
jgi:hypothetical protein